MLGHPTDSLKLGQFSNAFRIIQEQDVWYLDFLVYSARENRASVVSRVRVDPEYLLQMHLHLSEILSGIQAANFPSTGPTN
jgi:hypothetical protein